MSAIKLLGQVQLGTGLTTIYQAPAFPVNLQTRIASIWLANTDSAARTITLRVGTGTLTTANSLGEAWTIPANTTYFLSGSDWSLVLSAGQALQGFSDSAAKITVTVCGDESE